MRPKAGPGDVLRLVIMTTKLWRWFRSEPVLGEHHATVGEDVVGEPLKLHGAHPRALPLLVDGRSRIWGAAARRRALLELCSGRRGAGLVVGYSMLNTGTSGMGR